MSGVGAKGVVENGATAANSLPKPFDRAHALRPKSVANATLPFLGKARLQRFSLHPHRSSSGDLATAFIYSLDSWPLPIRMSTGKTGPRRH